MTIDEAIRYYEDKNVVLTEEEALANTIAINIMHKYQKIAEIITNNELEWGNASVRANAFLEVKKVVEDGQNTI